jgi:hypothetical protein
MPGLKESELLQACTILYGSGNHVSQVFLETLKLADLKMAFRRRSLETHPDRFLHLATPFQLKMLLIHQQRQQPLIGEYFVGQGIVSPGQLNRLAEILENRNASLEARLTRAPNTGTF